MITHAPALILLATGLALIAWAVAWLSSAFAQIVVVGK